MDRPEELPVRTDTGSRHALDPEVTVRLVGERIRVRRQQLGLTLQEVGEATGISASMLSLVERGKTSPSIGTLVAVASALGLQLPEMFDVVSDEPENVVIRFADQHEFQSDSGMVRRIVTSDTAHGVELVVSEYAPGASNAPYHIRHSGFEYAVLIEGALVIDVDGIEYELSPGDGVAFSSLTPHRIWNPGTHTARAVWVDVLAHV